MGRKVDYEQGFTDALCHGFRMMKHVIQSDLSCVRMTQYDHSQGVAYQQKIQAQNVQEAPHGIVISRQSCKFMGRTLLFSEDLSE